MSYQVLARKWRPPQFSEVVGQEPVTRALENAIRSGRIAHAFLFTGVRGVGKTTTARILAKALNCHEGVRVEPCDECVSCREIAASASVDVQEIDAASNTSVDDVREIRESVQYGTARDRFKIFIIDEVHMLSRAAFNALLKTLEEPPAHVKFILATTELHKIPVTITSRCQQYEFRPIPFVEICGRLRHICEQESIRISDWALDAVATAARGSLRDAQSALDRVVALSGLEVNDEDVKRLLGVLDERILNRLMESLIEQDREGLLTAVEELVESGTDPQQFCQRFLQHLRNLMVFKAAGWNPRLLQLPDSDEEMVRTQAEAFSELDLIRFYDALEHTAQDLKFQPDPFIHIEISLMKLVELARLPTLETAIRQLRSSPAPSPSQPELVSTVPPARTSPSPAAAKPESRPSTPPPEEEQRPTGEKGPARQLLERVQKEKMGLYPFLRSAARVESQEGKLVILFPANEKFSYSMLSKAENVGFLSSLWSELAGSNSVEIVIEEGKSDDGGKQDDPLEDERVQAFLKEFPSKYTVDREE